MNWLMFGFGVIVFGVQTDLIIKAIRDHTEAGTRTMRETK